MHHSHCKTLTRVSALILALMLVLSFTTCFAESFKKSGAGIRYGGKSFKLGDSTTAQKLKKAFGSYTVRKDNGCTCGYAIYEYTFSGKGLVIETLQKKKGDSKQKIITITVKKNKVPTIAGLKIGHKTSKIADKYGKNCTKSGSRVRYHSGKYYMTISTKNKKVTKIVFMLDL